LPLSPTAITIPLIESFATRRPNFEQKTRNILIEIVNAANAFRADAPPNKGVRKMALGKLPIPNLEDHKI
jgi:hypothetical protein